VAATSASELADGMQRSAVSAQNVGVSMERLVAYINNSVFI